MSLPVSTFVPTFRRDDDDGDGDSLPTLDLTTLTTVPAFATTTTTTITDTPTLIVAAESKGSGKNSSVTPAIIILPILIGFSLLLLAVGSFIIWRRKRQDASASTANLAEGEGAVVMKKVNFPVSRGVVSRGSVGLMGIDCTDCAAGGSE